MDSSNDRLSLSIGFSASLQIHFFNFPGLGWAWSWQQEAVDHGVRHDDSIYIENWGPKGERVPDDQWASPYVLRAPPKPQEQITFEDYARTFAPIYDYYRSD